MRRTLAIALACLAASPAIASPAQRACDALRTQPAYSAPDRALSVQCHGADGSLMFWRCNPTDAAAARRAPAGPPPISASISRATCGAPFGR